MENLRTFCLVVAVCIFPSESLYFFSQATMMHLIGHFESSFSLVVMWVATLNSDEPEISDKNVCPPFLSLLNEHSGTLSELYCVSFELIVFCSLHYVLWKSSIGVCVWKMWYNQNESPTRWPFLLDVTRRVWLQNIIWPVSLSVFLRCIQVVLYQFCDPRTLIILFLYTIYFVLTNHVSGVTFEAKHFKY